VCVGAEAATRLLRFGRNELVSYVKPKWKIFVEQFTGPMPCMIWMAAGVELIIHDWPNFWILLVLQTVNGGLGYHESTKAGDAVAALRVRSPRHTRQPSCESNTGRQETAL
jgi:H+-transporting ATPase